MQNKSFLAVAFFVLGSAIGSAQISVGIRIGPPPAPRVVRVQPRSPGPGYFWVDGYWYPNGKKYKWHEGYWTRPPYQRAHWIGPQYEGNMFYEGRWEGDQGNRNHDHKWDRDRDRDFRGDRDRH
jgi:hypothetical protein